MGNAIFLGEALVPLKDIPATGNDANLADLPQMQIPLSKPTDLGTSLLSRSELTRHFDELITSNGVTESHYNLRNDGYSDMTLY